MYKMLLAFSALMIANSCVAQDQDWRPVAPQNLLLIKTTYGEVAVELNPQFAPKHTQRLRDLAKAHFYDGLSFYRVIDGFVAQGGR
ncbi:MAG: peptidylprolyl isomerase, partial [Robiginitomaculum sp.]